MMGTVIDLSGHRFGRLSVIKYVGLSQNNKAQFLCMCDCGNETTVLGNGLRVGDTKSCGCLQRESVIKKNFVHGMAPRKNRPRIYTSYHNMITRCEDVKNNFYKNYGGRGIKICDRWHDFENFLSDMGEPPSDDLTIERINNNGNYELSNCKWATMKEQNNNRRDTRFLEFYGLRKSLSQWSEITKIPRSTLRDRIYRGWPLSRSFTKPLKRVEVY
jgi:hypothetical protein